MTTYQSSGLKRAGFRVRFADGSTKRVNTRAQAAAVVAARGESQDHAQLLRVGRSRNGALVDQPVDW